MTSAARSANRMPSITLPTKSLAPSSHLLCLCGGLAGLSVRLAGPLRSGGRPDSASLLWRCWPSSPTTSPPPGPMWTSQLSAAVPPLRPPQAGAADPPGTAGGRSGERSGWCGRAGAGRAPASGPHLSGPGHGPAPGGGGAPAADGLLRPAEKGLGGAVEPGPAGHLQATALLDQLPLQQQPHGVGAVHAPDLVHIGPVRSGSRYSRQRRSPPRRNRQIRPPKSRKRGKSKQGRKNLPNPGQKSTWTRSSTALRRCRPFWCVCWAGRGGASGWSP